MERGRLVVLTGGCGLLPARAPAWPSAAGRAGHSSATSTHWVVEARNVDIANGRTRVATSFPVLLGLRAYVRRRCRAKALLHRAGVRTCCARRCWMGHTGWWGGVGLAVGLAPTLSHHPPGGEQPSPSSSLAAERGGGGEATTTRRHDGGAVRCGVVRCGARVHGARTCCLPSLAGACCRWPPPPPPPPPPLPVFRVV